MLDPFIIILYEFLTEKSLGLLAPDIIKSLIF